VRVGKDGPAAASLSTPPKLRRRGEEDGGGGGANDESDDGDGREPTLRCVRSLSPVPAPPPNTVVAPTPATVAAASASARSGGAVPRLDLTPVLLAAAEEAAQDSGGMSAAVRPRGGGDTAADANDDDDDDDASTWADGFDRPLAGSAQLAREQRRIADVGAVAAAGGRSSGRGRTLSSSLGRLAGTPGSRAGKAGGGGGSILAGGPMSRGPAAGAPPAAAPPAPPTTDTTTESQPRQPQQHYLYDDELPADELRAYQELRAALLQLGGGAARGSRTPAFSTTPSRVGRTPGTSSAASAAAGLRHAQTLDRLLARYREARRGAEAMAFRGHRLLDQMSSEFAAQRERLAQEAERREEAERQLDEWRSAGGSMALATTTTAAATAPANDDPSAASVVLAREAVRHQAELAERDKLAGDLKAALLLTSAALKRTGFCEPGNAVRASLPRETLEVLDAVLQDPRVDAVLPPPPRPFAPPSRDVDA